jgi:23S rRNA (uridine2552-2'-O)-methyltransferase
MAKSSQRWLQEHQTDIYVKQAKQAGYRSRAVYKLAQLDARDHLFRLGMTIIDLGAAPGSWAQWITERLSKQVKIFALDLLPMEPLPNVTFIQGDFREPAILEQLLQQLGTSKADLVMSDMAPNLSGLKAIDQPRIMLLAELTRELAWQVLKPQGHLLTKVFQGEGFDAYLQSLKPRFEKIFIRKPQASRSRSAEIYIVAKNYLPP